MLNPIETESEYAAVLARVYDLMQINIEKGSANYDELETLSKSINEYELAHYPLG